MTGWRWLHLFGGALPPCRSSRVAGQPGNTSCVPLGCSAVPRLFLLPLCLLRLNCFLIEFQHFCSDTYSVPQLSATDISAQAPMKGAAKCDNHCELQNSVNQWILERALHSWDIPGSMPASVLVEPSCRYGPCVHSCVFVCHGCAFGWSEWHMQECSKRAAASATCELASHLCYRFLQRSNQQLFLSHAQHEVRSANPLNLSI